MRRIEPWTQVECETCGMPHMATRTQPLDLEDGVVLECPECAAYRRGHADGLREAEQAQRAEPKQIGRRQR